MTRGNNSRSVSTRSRRHLSPAISARQTSNAVPNTGGETMTKTFGALILAMTYGQAPAALNFSSEMALRSH